MEKVLEKVKQWLSDTFDQNTRVQVQKLLDDNTADFGKSIKDSSPVVIFF